jgi:glycosyltransferase involved in cell wall biosynthesis
MTTLEHTRADAPGTSAAKGRLPRLAVFTTHPIQYQAPWFKALYDCGLLDLKVFFSFLPTAERQGRGFGVPFSWDVPLRDGYPNEVVEGSDRFPGLPDFFRPQAKGIGMVLSAYKPDIAMIMGWQHVSLVQAFLACRLRHIPVIFRGDSNDRRERPRLVRLLHRAYVSQADAALAVGTGSMNFFRNAGLPKDRVLAARYVVENERFGAQARELRIHREEIRQGWGIPAGASCALFVGKLEEKKRVFDFIGALGMAYERGMPIHGLIVGTGDQMEMARQFAQAVGAPVTFAGFLNQSEIVRAYVAGDFIVLPSDFGETWGLVINEAMICERTAIVSERVGCAGDLVRDGETGLVVPFADRDALCAAMLRLADPQVRRGLAQNAYALVSSDYSMKQAVDSTIAAVRTLLESTRGTD